jgi:HEAT repeat protein
LSYGATQKRKALGLTIDLKGNDRYYAKMQGQGESCGGVMPPKFPQHWSHAVLLDLSGEDYYELPGRRDNTYFKYHHHGVCYDTASAGKALPDQAAMVIGAPRSLSEALYNAALATPYDRVNIKKLLDRDLFVRFAALGELLQGGLPVLHSMLAVLASSPDRELNRDLLEVLNAYFLAGQMNSQFISALEALLTAPDPYVQQSAARFLGALKQPGALAALSRALPVVAQETRVHVIWALGNIGSHDALGPLLALAPPQASNLIDRRAAVEALKTVALQKPFLTATDKQTIRSSLSALVNDGDEIIRFHAVMGLNSFKEDPAVLALVRAKLDDASIYVQRAAAHTVIEAGHKEGIPILIASLRFPSIDTFEFYDEDLPKDLAFYCGIDFPDDQRYDHRTWQQWWQKHQKEVNLSHNLAIKREIEAAFATYPEQSGLATFDRLMQTETGNRMIMRRYGRFCRDRIRYLLGHQKMTREIIARCVALQRRLVALEPDNPKTLKQLQLFETQLSGYG